MDLISKKELLLLTGISYGQLYRWKRQKLIPEEWFMKQASFTGQETFFPREPMLERVRAILNAKDRYSLEELADVFSPESVNMNSSGIKLQDIEEISRSFLPEILAVSENKNYSFWDIVLFTAIAESAERMELEEKQCLGFLQRGITLKPEWNSVNLFFLAIQLQEEILPVLSKSEVLWFDSTVKIVDSFSLRELSGRLKMKYQLKLA